MSAIGAFLPAKYLSVYAMLSFNLRADSPAAVQLVNAIHTHLRVAIFSDHKIRLISAKPLSYPLHPTTLSEHLLKRRRELVLFQRDAAERLGVSHEGYLTWEKHGRSPKIWHWPKIINFLGYDPFPRPSTFAERLAAYRRRTGLTHGKLGKLLGVHECTVQSWERGRHPPRRSRTSLERLERLLQRTDR